MKYVYVYEKLIILLRWVDCSFETDISANRTGKLLMFSGRVFHRQMALQNKEQDNYIAQVGHGVGNVWWNCWPNLEVNKG